MSILTHTVNEKFLDNLKDYCTFAKDSDYMTVTEWANGEGVTVEINSTNMKTRLFQLSYGELDALNVLVNYRGTN